MDILDNILGKRNEIPIIDASDDMNIIIKELIKHYKDYCNYDEILKIEEKDQLPILQYIWGKWAVHSSSIEKDLGSQYPQYDFKNIEFIVINEHHRVNTLYKQQQAIKTFESGSKDCLLLQPFASFSCQEEENKWRRELNQSPDYKELDKVFHRQLCMIYDMHKLSKVWYYRDNYIDKYSFSPYTNKITKDSLKNLKFWVNGEIKQLIEQEFLEWCKKYDINYPLNTSFIDNEIDELNKSYKEGKISKEKYEKLITFLNSRKK